MCHAICEVRGVAKSTRVCADTAPRVARCAHPNERNQSSISHRCHHVGEVGDGETRAVNLGAEREIDGNGIQSGVGRPLKDMTETARRLGTADFNPQKYPCERNPSKEMPIVGRSPRQCEVGSTDAERGHVHGRHPCGVGGSRSIAN